MPIPARIVLLNGVGSVGKSSIARALQSQLDRPFLHVQMDAFLEMLPAWLQSHPDGLRFEAGEEHGAPSVAVGCGPAAQRCLEGMRHAVVALADRGNDLIVDDVMMGASGGELAEYRELLARHRLSVVGIHAPLAVLEARERARGDRLIGLARWQFPRVHAGIVYDLEIDASTATAEACAALIREKLGL